MQQPPAAPPVPPAPTAHRRWIGRLVRAGLVIVAVALVAGWLWQRVRRAPEIEIASDAPAASALGPGDVQIFNRDSSVNLILQGEHILAGLSPQTVARVRAELEAAATKDTSGFGGAIAQMVTRTVADRIDTHFSYSLRDMRDIRYEDGEIVIERKDGNTTRLFRSAKVNGQPMSKSFPPADAQRFVELARARLRSLP